MKVEVQLRTIAMDFWASLEHKAFYKKNIPEKEKEFIAKELRECAEKSSELDIRMQEINRRVSEVRQNKPEGDTLFNPLALLQSKE